jgi:hypothetical protein
MLQLGEQFGKMAADSKGLLKAERPNGVWSGGVDVRQAKVEIVGTSDIGCVGNVLEEREQKTLLAHVLCCQKAVDENVAPWRQPFQVGGTQMRESPQGIVGHSVIVVINHRK